MKLFSDEKVNGGRQLELDIAKCLAIVFMIALHCWFLTSYFDYNVSAGMQRIVGHLLGGPFAAPVFMFAMGVGIVYSKHQEPFYLIKRGILLMLLGLVVNLGEYFVPHYLGKALLGKDVFALPTYLYLFIIDILAFAGMAFILIGILKKLNVSPIGIVVVAIILSRVGSLVRFYDFKSEIPNLISGYFIGSKGGFTAFPLFNWFIFPAVGILFGEYYKRCTDKKKLLCLWPVALFVSVEYFVNSWNGGFLQDDIHYYYFLTTKDALFCLLCIYGVIGLCYLVARYLPDCVARFFSRTSSNLNAIYVIQWFLIPITYIFIVYFKKGVKFGDLSLIIISIIEIIVCAALAAGYKKIKKFLKEKNYEK